MAAVTELTVKANIAELRKELGKIPGITATEAKAMAGQLVRESKKAGKAAEKAAKKSKKAWGGNTTAIGKAAHKMKGFGTAAKAAAAPIALIGAGLIATSAAAFKLAQASSEMIDELINGAALAGLSIQDYTALGAALNATGSSSEKLAPAMGKMIDAMQKAREGSVEGVRAFGNLGVEVLDSAGNLRDAGEVAREVAAGLAGLSSKTDRSAAAQAVFGKRNAEVGLKLAESIPLLDEFSKTADKMITDEALAASADFDESMARLKLNAQAATVTLGTQLTPAITGVMDAMSQVGPDIIKDLKPVIEMSIAIGKSFVLSAAVLYDLAEVAVAAGRIMTDSFLAPLRNTYAITQQIAKLSGKILPDLEFLNVTPENSGLTAMRDKLAEINTEQNIASKLAAVLWPDTAEGVAEVDKELAPLPRRLALIETAAKKATSAIKDNTDALIKQWQGAKAYGDEIRQMVIDDAQADLESHAAFVDNVLSHTANAAGEISSIAGEFSQRLADEGTEAAKEQARAAFAISKAAAMSQIVISTAIAAMNIQEKFAAAPPVAAALTAVLMGTSAANMALVASEQPSFHRGGMISPDEVSITAQKGEAVLSRSGVAAAGGESGVNSLNSGAAGGGGVMIINQVYRHRVFDRVVSDSIRRTNSPLNKALNAGRRVGMSK
tara:strand:+ start:8394 stop:10394 length:2001 start_codon:yes stop_codon:yes gene_type:complete